MRTALRGSENGKRRRNLKRSSKTAFQKHAFLQGLAPEHLSRLHRYAQERAFKRGAYLKRQGDPADEIYLIRKGRVALEISLPHDGPVRIEGLGEGAVLGWSCLVEPYRWRFDARAISDVEMFAVDTARLREQCERDAEFGYAILSRCAAVIVERLEATQLKVLELHQAQG